MYKHALCLFILSLTSNVSLAANYILEGSSFDGWTVEYSSDPPATVTQYRRKTDGSFSEYIQFENENCSLDGKKFACDGNGKSPLSGTEYQFDKIVGTGCLQTVIYRCMKNCKINIQTPELLLEKTTCI